MDKLYKYTQQLHFRYNDMDFKDETRISTVLSFLQEAACKSADELGFGYNYLKEKNWAFIVASTYVEFYKPMVYESILKVYSWPLPPKKITFEREYEIKDFDENKYASAVSRWCLIDLKTNRFLFPSNLKEQDYSTYNPTLALSFQQWKIEKTPKEDAEFCYSIKVKNSECDHYFHINNTKYADYCLNCFTLKELTKMKIKSFLVNYEKQCKEGDVLSFYKFKMKEDAYHIFAINQRDEQVVEFKIEYNIEE